MGDLNQSWLTTKASISTDRASIYSLRMHVFQDVSTGSRVRFSENCIRRARKLTGSSVAGQFRAGTFFVCLFPRWDMRPAQWLGLGPGICRLLVPLLVSFTADVNSRWPADRHSVCVNQCWANTGQALEQTVVFRTRYHTGLRVLGLMSQRGGWDGTTDHFAEFQCYKENITLRPDVFAPSCRQGHSAFA